MHGSGTTSAVKTISALLEILHVQTQHLHLHIRIRIHIRIQID
jgi:hypothetical protein